MTTDSGPNLPRWLSPEQVSELTGLGLESLRKMRTLRRGIPFYKPDSKTVRYDPAEVEAYMRSTVVEPISRRDQHT